MEMLGHRAAFNEKDIVFIIKALISIQWMLDLSI